MPDLQVAWQMGRKLTRRRRQTQVLHRRYQSRPKSRPWSDEPGRGGRQSVSMTRTSTLLLTALLGGGLVAAGIAGCDGGSSASPNPSASGSAQRQQALAAGRNWVQCLRDHGVTRMPDATLDHDGYLQFGNDNYDWKRDLQTHKSAITACDSLHDALPPDANRPKQQYSADDLRKLAEYAKCIRAHGIPDFPDPDAQGMFDFTGTSLANGGNGPKQDAANDACKGVWSGSIEVNGGPGGGKK